MSSKNFLSRAPLCIAAAATLISFGSPAMLRALPTAQPAQPVQRAQVDARWQPWIGCWQPAPPQRSGPATFSAPRRSNAPLVCIVPTQNGQPSSVSVVTIEKGKVVAQDTIVADGQSIAHSKDHCDGVESASWSPDGHRLYVTSDYTCPGNLKRTSSGLFAIAPNGDWVNVQSVDASGRKGVSTLRYADAGRPSDLPPDVAEALNAGGFETSTARVAAGAPLTTADVVEASHHVDPSVVEAWLIDRGQNFHIDAKQLVALSDAGLPGSVTDAMVAVSYPKAFMVNPSGVADASGVDSSADGVELQRSPAQKVDVMMVPAYSPYDYSPFMYGPYGYYGLGYGPYGYSPYGYPGYGYSAYGYAPYGAYYSPYAGYPLGYYGGVYLNNQPPVIVLRGQPAQRGYVVRGRGYTRTAPGSAGSNETAQPRSNVSPPAEAAPSAPRAPSEPSSSGRTAHRRP
jgi:hypothetical protein